MWLTVVLYNILRHLVVKNCYIQSVSTVYFSDLSNTYRIGIYTPSGSPWLIAHVKRKLLMKNSI